MKLKLFLPLIILLITSCGTSETTHNYTAEEVTHKYVPVDENIEEDEEMSVYLNPYIREMAGVMNRVLTISEGPFERASPEGSLGNLTADIIRYRATAEMRETVHVSVMNNGGLRAPLPEGEVTVGHVYELMPFDSRITVLKFSGEQLLRIASELAEANGEPVSGLRFRIEDGVAKDILVASRNVDPDRYYLVATNDWMANGGGRIPTLWEPVERHDLDVLIREALKFYFTSVERLTPYLDQRVRN